MGSRPLSETALVEDIVLTAIASGSGRVGAPEVRARVEAALTAEGYHGARWAWPSQQAIDERWCALDDDADDAVRWGAP